MITNLQINKNGSKTINVPSQDLASRKTQPLLYEGNTFIYGTELKSLVILVLCAVTAEQRLYSARDYGAE